MAGTSVASVGPVHLLGLPSWSQRRLLLAGRLSNNLAKPKNSFPLSLNEYSYKTGLSLLANGN